MNTERELELALESVIEIILAHGQYPAKGRVQFDLHEFLLEKHLRNSDLVADYAAENK